MVLLLTDKALFYCLINRELILNNLTSKMELTTNGGRECVTWNRQAKWERHGAVKLDQMYC